MGLQGFGPIIYVLARDICLHFFVTPQIATVDALDGAPCGRFLRWLRGVGMLVNVGSRQLRENTG